MAIKIIFLVSNK